MELTNYKIVFDKMKRDTLMKFVTDYGLGINITVNQHWEQSADAECHLSEEIEIE